MMDCVVSPLAEADLDEIWLYLAREAGQNAADRLLDAIIQGILMLSAHPEAGRARPDIHAGVRSFPVGSFVIYYRATSSTLEVARVLHGSRDHSSAGI